ncbi:MAG TPA: hypothetical protein VFU21_28985 [Kofleriaceae bacterium]|nr:hypothetical protein [Kofleriaceae bacterium]
MRVVLLAALLSACGKADEEKKPPPPAPAAPRADAAAPDPDLPRHWVEPTAAAALARMLEQVTPRVLGVGEVHLVQGGPRVRSALDRFTGDMLAGLRGRASDLVVETWVSAGSCGKAEKQVTADVKAKTERPPETESEIGRLLRRASELGMKPRVMTMRCEQYEKIRSKTGEIDYDGLLQLIGGELHRNVRAVLEGRPHASVVVYGGALHNDRAPNEGVAAYSYGARLAGELGDGYVELDLYVPELVAADELMRAEPWFPLLARAAGKVVLVERGPGSYIMLLERGVTPAQPSSNTTSTQ